MGRDIELPAYAQDDGSLDEDDGEAELAGLISRSRLSVPPQHAAARRSYGDNDFGRRSGRPLRTGSFLLLLTVAIVFAHRHVSSDDGSGGTVEYAPPVGHKPNPAFPSVSPVTSKPVLVAGDASGYTCPAITTSQHKRKHYTPEIHQLAERHNKTLAEYRKGPLDGWGISYSKLRKLLRPWKEEAFVHSLQSGDVIFESACGVGINLLITAEILQSHSITDLTVHGNDYNADNVKMANQIWSSKDVTTAANKGKFCQGDSSRLADFVPASSFDLSYPGYLVPLIPSFPPLETEEENWEYSVSLCNSTDPKDIKLRDREQRTQEEWVSAWVKGLLHMTKPGKVVAVENVAYPLCSDEGGRDWGGVTKDWWTSAVDEYSWDVELDSLLIRDEGSVKGWKEQRYHVMMRKKNHAEKKEIKQDDDKDESSSICPSHTEKSVNDKNDDFSVYLLDDNAHLNKTLSEFRTMELDGWGIKFQEVKDLLRPWKEEVFVNNIQSGDSIFESAMGIGMNLLISAEILKEHHITDLTVSGNDYVGESIAIANRVWDEEEAKQLASKGSFCRGDSTRLDFVPNESADFSYTGYIDPITDPLDLYPSNMTVEEKWEHSVKLCKSVDKEDQRLAKKAQKIQNDWYAKWVEHLVRIAKSGKVIAIENGAESLCTNPLDWGGVDKSWWKEAIDTYGWDVDPASLLIRDEAVVGNWKDFRYHVMMRKNG